MRRVKEELEYLRQQKRNEVLSYLDIIKLQSVKEFIDPEDVELLETAGIPEGGKENV